jgi:hypothetical protein
MKNNFLLIICITLSALFFNSCKKDDVVNNDPPPNSLASDSTYLLTRAYSLAKNISSGLLDTTSRIVFFYDNLNRLTKIIDTSGTVVSLNRTITNTQFFYTASDTLPNRTKETTYQNFNSNTNYDTYFYYNNTGQLVKDSEYVGYPIINNYSYQNNIIYGTETIIYNGVVYAGSRKDTMIINANGNIGELRNRTYYSPLNSLNNIQSNGIYTFDNKKCPSSNKIGFPKLSLSKKNNLVKYTLTKKNVITNQIEDIFYQDFSIGGIYNTAGYPTVFRDLTPIVFQNNPPIPYEVKRLYFYTAF